MALVGIAPAALALSSSACRQDGDITQPIARFKYDSRNRRVARQDAATGQWLYTVFDVSGNPLSELVLSNGTWRQQRDYVWLEGHPLAQVEYGSSGATQVYYFHVDAIGMPRAMTNAWGQVVWNTYPKPFGDIAEKTTTDPLSGQVVVTNLRLPGQYDERLLGSLGLQGPYYNWNRWYLPGVGRYLEPDPLAMAGGFNTQSGVDWYNYAEGNPLTNTDPTGEAIWTYKPDCARLAQRIQNVHQKIRQRIGELDEDPQGLPETCAGDKLKPSLSRSGHRMLINMDKANLAALKALYAMYCGGNGPAPFPNPFPVPPPAPVPGSPLSPLPSPSPFPAPSPADTAAVGGAGLLLLMLFLLPVGA